MEGNPRDAIIPIIADDRERCGGVMEFLYASRRGLGIRALPHFDVAVRRLAVGDYQVDGRFLFERKTLRIWFRPSSRDDCLIKPCGSPEWRACARPWC